MTHNCTCETLIKNTEGNMAIHHKMENVLVPLAPQDKPDTEFQNLDKIHCCIYKTGFSF
jgi:hypothetical protein